MDLPHRSLGNDRLSFDLEHVADLVGVAHQKQWQRIGGRVVVRGAVQVVVRRGGD